MRIHSESRIHHPLELVYETYRDRLPEIAKFMPDIREIVVRNREEGEHGIELHNEWVADRDLPRVVKGVLRPEMLRWDDYAKWNDAERRVDWTIGFRAFPNQVHCAGRNAFAADGPEATKVMLTGKLDIDLRNVPGVPRMLAGRVAPKIEEFIVRLITPNLERVNESLERFLDAELGL